MLGVSSDGTSFGVRKPESGGGKNDRGPHGRPVGGARGVDIDPKQPGFRMSLVMSPASLTVREAVCLAPLTAIMIPDEMIRADDSSLDRRRS